MYKVHETQSVLDVAMHIYGDTSAAAIIAVINGISITDVLEAGMELQLPTLDKRNAVIRSLNNRSIIPATALSADNLTNPEGIEFWYVEYDFVVS